jgi:hypothetical protein
MGIKVKCKNCNKEADSDGFRLHYKYKMMVCPDCFSGRYEHEKQKKAEAQRVKVIKPSGWDAEDEYLSKYKKMKEKQEMKFKRMPGTNQIQCTCNDCEFSFKYDPFQKRPKNCPYCNKEVPRMNTFKLL